MENELIRLANHKKYATLGLNNAEVVKLVDTLDSGSSPVTGVGVRIPSSAPFFAPTE